MCGKYERLRTEIESIYYADYIIDRLYERIKIKAMDYTDEKWFENITEAIEKLCRFQIYYSNNYNLLYNSKYKDLVIDCVIKGRKIKDSERYGLLKFYRNWETNKVGI